jgi:PAS domain S-box-containing protein
MVCAWHGVAAGLGAAGYDLALNLGRDGWWAALLEALLGAVLAALCVLLVVHWTLRRFLRRRTADMAAVIDALPLMIFARNKRGRFLLANRIAGQAFGAVPTEMIGKSLEDLGKDEPGFRKGLEADQQVMAEGKPQFNSIESVVYPDGSTRWFQFSRIPARLGERRLPAVITLAVDLTEQRQAEEAFRQSEAALQGLLLAAPIGIGLISENTLGWTNQHVSDMTGYARDEMMGKPLRMLFTSDADLERISRQCTDLGPNDTVASEARLAHKEGATIDVLWSCSQLRRPGAPPSLVFTMVDISEQKQAQSALRASQLYNRTLFDQSTVGLVVTRMNGQILDANVAFATIVGRPPSEVVKLSLADITPPEARATTLAQLNIVARTGRYGPVETLLLSKDGRTIPVRTSGQVLERAGEMFVLSSVEDISQRHRLEEQFRHAQKMEAVGQLAGGVAHDFNNQLTVIQGYSDLLLRGLKPTDPLYAPLVEIRRASERSRQLTSQLLAFSRKQVLHPEVLDLRQVLAELSNPLGRILSERVDLVVNIPSKLDPAKLDRGQLEQGLMNLVINARDAMPEGGRLTLEADNVNLTRRYTSLHPDVEPGDYVVVTVSDTGVGMDEETLRHAFDPFFTTKDVGKGTGLGLAMVYGFVQQSGGTISVYSELGKGTTFRLYFPVSTESRGPAVVREPSQLPHGSEHVLVVEDEESVRQFATRVLRQCGYGVMAAANAKEALSILERREERIDMLLTDIVMPGLSGMELAERLRAMHPDIKVLYMTGYAPSTIRAHGDLEPGKGLLVKPFSPEALSQAVRRALDHAPAAP